MGPKKIYRVSITSPSRLHLYILAIAFSLRIASGGQATTTFERSLLAKIHMAWLEAIYNFFYELFFGCCHGNLTRPFTIRKHSYKVCLDCGTQFPYSLEKMRLLHAWEIEKPQQEPTELTPVPVSSKAQEDYGNKAIA